MAVFAGKSTVRGGKSMEKHRKFHGKSRKWMEKLGES
jgi:hypothetical protein